MTKTQFNQFAKACHGTFCDDCKQTDLCKRLEEVEDLNFILGDKDPWDTVEPEVRKKLEDIPYEQMGNISENTHKQEGPDNSKL